jgi:hypothetical protein
LRCGHETGPAGQLAAAFWGLSAAFLGLSDMAISALAATGWRRGIGVRVLAMDDDEDTSAAHSPGLAPALAAATRREATA